MTKKSFLNRFNRIIFTSLTAMAISIPAYAEFVFLNDGSIIEGNIIADSADAITIREKNNKQKQIQRGTIMRILYTRLSLGKVYVQKRDGKGM